MKRQLIPIQHVDWIDYKDSVYIIEQNDQGNYAQFQFNGVMCHQGGIQGFLAYSFKSSLKYFSSDFWYLKTTWTSDSSIVYFDTDKLKKMRPNVDFGGTKKTWEKLEQFCNQKGKPAKDILTAIKKEVESNLNIEIEFDFDNFNYGLHWYEAYIPIKIKNKSYLLTWENCD